MGYTGSTNRLWHLLGWQRSGRAIPGLAQWYMALYTSVPSGLLGVSDFIEFYGTVNDGKADKSLYKYDSLQMWDKVSLYTDTAAYFLTVKNGSKKSTSGPPILLQEMYYLPNQALIIRSAKISG